MLYWDSLHFRNCIFWKASANHDTISIQTAELLDFTFIKNSSILKIFPHYSQQIYS
jgi:hypothetical protein